MRPLVREYNISKSAGHCNACGKALQAGAEFVAVVRFCQPDELHREDFCTACWEKSEARLRQGSDMLGFWHGQVPLPRQKKKLFVDDEVLVQFFERLDSDRDQADQAKVGFRFVLALILMRKRLLRYQGSAKDDSGREVWTMRLKGGDQDYGVVDPHMDEQTIAEVSGQLSRILEEEL